MWFILINFIWTVAITILYAKKLANITQMFLFFFGFLTSNFLVLFFSFIFLVFIISFFKKVSAKNTIYLLSTMAMVSTPLLLRTFVYKIHDNVNSKNYQKIIERSNNKIVNEHYILSTDSLSSNLDPTFSNQDINNHYADLINSSYLFPILTLNNNFDKNLLFGDYIKNSYKSKYNNLDFISSLEETSWNLKNEYFIYEINSPKIINFNNQEIINFINENIYKKIHVDLIKGILEKIKNPIWILNEFSNNEVNDIKTLLGVNDKNIQYLRRDFDKLIKDNNELKNIILKEFEENFYELIDFMYRVNPLVISQNIQSQTSPFYIKDLIPKNKINNIDKKIEDKDKDFLINYMVVFLSNNKVAILNENFKRFEISLDNFNNVFANISNQKEWANYVLISSNKLVDTLRLIAELNSLSLADNQVFRFKLSPNDQIINTYKYTLRFRIKTIDKNNLILLMSLFVLSISLLLYLTIRSKQKEI
ncbi:hypothetical protein [[Mycoplasma] phocae]|uniref:hypothetical protein n=1 Tax=[Mycoplasma] phocae TaxID=142651 RepID=UPI0011AB7410|nr:hypothetical protein [[Mycoplasma] phocae]